MGSQPSAYSAMCAKSFGPAAPPISVRGPVSGLAPARSRGGVGGLGCARLARTDAKSPS